MKINMFSASNSLERPDGSWRGGALRRPRWGKRIHGVGEPDRQMDHIDSGGPDPTDRGELVAAVDNQHPQGWGWRLQLRDYDVRSGMCGRRWSEDKERRSWMVSERLCWE